MPPSFTLGLDLGQTSDYTALCVLQRQEPTAGGAASYDLIDLQRWRGEPYTAVPGRVERVRSAILDHHPPAATAWSRGRAYPPRIELIADATGVGRAVLDFLRDAGLDPVAVTITGGDQVTSDPVSQEHRVPKRDLVATVALLLQQRRLRIAAALPLAETLREELTNFKVTISASGHDRYGAGGDALSWREQPHDDLVLSVALAAWFAEAGVGAEPMIWA